MRSRSTGQGTGIATSKSSTDVPPSYWSHYWYAPQLVCGTMASFQKVQELCLRKKGASCGAAVPQGSKTIIRTHSSHPHIEHLTLDQLPGICGLSAHDREHSKPPRSEPLRRGCFQPGTPLGRLRRSGRSQKQKPRQPRRLLAASLRSAAQAGAHEEGFAGCGGVGVREGVQG